MLVYLVCGRYLSTGVSLFQGAGNLLRIKGMAEMDSVRRTIGSADPPYIVLMYNSIFGFSFWRVVCALNIYWMGCSWYLFMVN